MNHVTFRMPRCIAGTVVGLLLLSGCAGGTTETTGAGAPHSPGPSSAMTEKAPQYDTTWQVRKDDPAPTLGKRLEAADLDAALQAATTAAETYLWQDRLQPERRYQVADFAGAKSVMTPAAYTAYLAAVRGALQRGDVQDQDTVQHFSNYDILHGGKEIGIVVAPHGPSLVNPSINHLRIGSYDHGTARVRMDVSVTIRVRKNGKPMLADLVSHQTYDVVSVSGRWLIARWDGHMDDGHFYPAT